MFFVFFVIYIYDHNKRVSAFQFQKYVSFFIKNIRRKSHTPAHFFNKIHQKKVSIITFYTPLQTG